MYLVRKLKLGTSDQLDYLAQASGELYSAALIYFWRIVRKKGIWLSSVAMEKIWNSKKMHAHSADAVVQSIFHALQSWRVRRGTDPKARPPHKKRAYYKMQWKKSAIKLKSGNLILSNGRGNKPLIIAWKWDMPVIVDIVFNNKEYVLIATYKVKQKAQPIGVLEAGVDLGEVHPAVAHDGKNTLLVNGRFLRSIKRYRNKVLGYFQRKLSTKAKGSNEYKILKSSLHKQLKKIDNQIRDITHKQSTKLISTLHKNGVQTVVIGDIRNIRITGKNLGKKVNQKVHQMSHGTFRHKITYKAELCGMKVVLINEAYTSQECPDCDKRNKPRDRNYRCKCGFTYHRDGVGARNILRKYRGESHVVGVMASTISLRYSPHMRCSL